MGQGQLRVTTLGVWAGGEACQCLGWLLPAPHSSLFRSSLSNEGKGRGLLAVMCAGAGGWGGKERETCGRGEGGRWNFVICFGERQAEGVAEVVAWQVVLIVKCVFCESA